MEPISTNANWTTYDQYKEQQYVRSLFLLLSSNIDKNKVVTISLVNLKPKNTSKGHCYSLLFIRLLYPFISRQKWT